MYRDFELAIGHRGFGAVFILAYPVGRRAAGEFRQEHSTGACGADADGLADRGDLDNAPDHFLLELGRREIAAFCVVADDERANLFHVHAILTEAQEVGECAPFKRGLVIVAGAAAKTVHASFEVGELRPQFRDGCIRSGTVFRKAAGELFDRAGGHSQRIVIIWLSARFERKASEQARCSMAANDLVHEVFLSAVRARVAFLHLQSLRGRLPCPYCGESSPQTTFLAPHRGRAQGQGHRR
jgi:hypothetical protein